MSTRPRFAPMAAIAVALLLMGSAVAAADTVLHPFLTAQPKQAPQENKMGEAMQRLEK